MDENRRRTFTAACKRRTLEEADACCSDRTAMYPILKGEHGAVKERRRHVQRPRYEKPERLATHGNEVWSRDSTKLLTKECPPVKPRLLPSKESYRKACLGTMLRGPEFGQAAAFQC